MIRLFLTIFVFGFSSGAGAADTTRIELRDAPVVSTPHVWFVYAIAADGEDRRLDVSEPLPASIALAQGWIGERMDGRILRTYQRDRKPLVLFSRLSERRAELESLESDVRPIYESLKRAKVLRAGQLYHVLFDAPVVSAFCGQAISGLKGPVAVQFLRGTLASGKRCFPQTLQVKAKAGYFEWIMIHEIFHMLGAVPKCSRHGHGDHVTDDNRDIMYAGPLPWRPEIIDVGNDDYYRHRRSDCPDLGSSPFLTTLR